MLPYVSYLRVYEPVAALRDSVRNALIASARDASSLGDTLDTEQRSALLRVVTSAALTIEPDQTAGAYVLRRQQRAYFCPVDLPLRSWLSLTALVNSLGDAAAHLILPPDSLVTAGDEFLRWRRDHPQEVPHIRQSTWGVPRTWFVLVTESEREVYDGDGRASVRYRAPVLDARRRLTAASRVLRAVFDDADLLDELQELHSWLESFDDSSWLELDYAGVARLLGDRLLGDASAAEVHRALEALSRRDYAAAGTAYRSFEERWRVVNALERAN